MGNIKILFRDIKDILQELSDEEDVIVAFLPSLELIILDNLVNHANLTKQLLTRIHGYASKHYDLRYVCTYNKGGYNDKNEIKIIENAENIVVERLGFETTEVAYTLRKITIHVNPKAINESLPREANMKQLERVKEISKDTDIGEVIADMEKGTGNLIGVKNITGKNVLTYEEYMRRNKKE